MSEPTLIRVSYCKCSQVVLEGKSGVAKSLSPEIIPSIIKNGTIFYKRKPPYIKDVTCGSYNFPVVKLKLKYFTLLSPSSDAVKTVPHR